MGCLEKFLSPLCSILVRNLRDKLRSSKKGSMSMTNYLVSMRTTADALFKEGVNMAEEDLVAYTIDGLDHTYVRIKSHLQLQKEMTFDTLLLILLNEVDVIRQNQPSKAPTTFIANRSETEQKSGGGDLVLTAEMIVGIKAAITTVVAVGEEDGSIATTTTITGMKIVTIMMIEGTTDDTMMIVDHMKIGPSTIACLCWNPAITGALHRRCCLLPRLWHSLDLVRSVVKMGILLAPARKEPT